MVQLSTFTAWAICAIEAVQAFPNLPLNTEGNKIIDSTGASFKYAGTNWPGHGEVMVPEGLQYQSIEKIVSDIKSLGMNSIRLTYAIQMVDQIFDNNGNDIDIKTAFTNGLGDDGADVLAKVLSSNPQFTESTTRLQVYDAIVAECGKQEIYIHLDNHMSKGAWCCSGNDSNTWWGDADFNADNWTRGLSYMATHGLGWKNLASMSLRNELREPEDSNDAHKNYNWDFWYQHVQDGAKAIHTANEFVLVALSGLNFDTDMSAVVQGSTFEPGTAKFSFDDFSGLEKKLVIELHNYQTDVDSCDTLKDELYKAGGQAMNPDDSTTANVFPVLITEFGFEQNGKAYKDPYSTCLSEILPTDYAGWMNWVVVGSYYTRQGSNDYDETWGLKTHDWSAWRDQAYVDEQLKPMASKTLEDSVDGVSRPPVSTVSTVLTVPTSFANCMFERSTWRMGVMIATILGLVFWTVCV